MKYQVNFTSHSEKLGSLSSKLLLAGAQRFTGNVETVHSTVILHYRSTNHRLND